MEYTILKQAILQNKIIPNIILAGDPILIDVYINKIASITTIKKLDNISQYFDLNNNKFKIDSNVIYVINDEQDFKSNNSLWDIDRSHLILCYPNLKKEKFYKAFEKDIIYFNKLTDEDLVGAIKFKANLSDSNIEKLISSCDHNYYKIMNELDKISIFNNYEHDKLFSRFASDNILCYEQKIDNFALSNSVLDRDKIKALQILSRIDNNNILGYLALIYVNLKNLLLVQNHCSNSNDIEVKAKELGISKGLYYILYKKKNKYTTEQLCINLIYLSNLINKIKLGLTDSLEAIYLFILRCI